MRGDATEGRVMGWRGEAVTLTANPSMASSLSPGRHRAHGQYGEEASRVYRGDQKCRPGRGAGVRGGPSWTPGGGRAGGTGHCGTSIWRGCSEQRLTGSFSPQAKVTANNDKNRTFSVWYVPEVTGTHKVSPQPPGEAGGRGSGCRVPTPPSQPALLGNDRSLCSLLASILPRALSRCMWTNPRVTLAK